MVSLDDFQVNNNLNKAVFSSPTPAPPSLLILDFLLFFPQVRGALAARAVIQAACHERAGSFSQKLCPGGLFPDFNWQKPGADVLKWFGLPGAVPGCALDDEKAEAWRNQSARSRCAAGIQAGLNRRTGRESRGT
ncbi:hypothetical protein MUN46_000155 [Mesosutterella sp. AGMB02718]|uniref:Uncharacterized protein n=1 Tax=Mesosutterella faecium TaxID=2925194 RepID=A0ABT7IJ30_9BURK|nr:hypothetical protein [Mesosutterella sp. AGMB02718]MDL2058377.1 hypothetical protein [Mesosutterella sp. AGMB02718]